MQNSQTNTFLKGMNLDTAKEFIGSDQYVDALDVHINTDAGATAGALQPYLDIAIDDDNDTLAGQKILGATTGHFGKDRENCYIVLSYNEADSKNLVSVFSTETNKLLWQLITSDLNCTTRAKLINLWETEKISRVYISSEDSYIQVVNLNQNYGTVDGVINTVESYDFSIFPQCGALPPFVFSDVVSGNKAAGKVQYAYQLFDENGRTTALSAISHMITIGAELQDTHTDSGIKLTLPVSSDMLQFKYIRVYELSYSNYADLPRVYVKDEVAFSAVGNRYTYADKTDTRLSEITLEEFQAIKSAVFKPATIEMKDNRLFAANVTEQVFDVDFDARVYSADKAGNVSIDGEAILLQNIVDGVIKIDEKTVFNNPNPNEYKYNTVFGPKINPTTNQNNTVGKDTYLFQGLLADKLTTSEFETYSIEDVDYVYGSYAFDEITELKVGDGVTLRYFPLSNIYFVNFETSQTQYFFGCVDDANKTIYKTKAISYNGFSVVESGLYDDGVTYYALSSGKSYQLNQNNQSTKYQLDELSSDGDVAVDYPYGGAGPKVSYMFVRPLLYLAPNTDLCKDNNIQFVSRDLTQNKYGAADEIKVLSDNVHASGWNVTHIKKDENVEHIITDLTYADPYVCANYTGFKQGESYTFGIVFYNDQNIASPVHFIGTIHIPYFDHWIFSAVKKDAEKQHDLVAATVGIRFRVDLSGFNDVRAYEIVRVQKTTDTRKILMQGLASNTATYPKRQGKYGVDSLGDNDLRNPMYPTISKQYYSMFKYSESDLEPGVLNTESNYSVFISPEISTNKENSGAILDLAAYMHPVKALSSVLYQEDLWLKLPMPTGNVPVFKHIAYATSSSNVEIDGKTKSDYGYFAGVPFCNVWTSGYDLYYNFIGIPVSTDYGGARVGHVLFKYYTPSDYGGTIPLKLEIQSIKFSAALDSDSLDKNQQSEYIVIGDKVFINVTTQDNADYDSEDAIKYEKDRSGIHSNCAVIRFENQKQLWPYAYNVIMMHVNWNESDNYQSFKSVDPLGTDGATKTSYDYEYDGNKFDWATINPTVLTTTRNTAVLADLCTNYDPYLQYSVLSSLNFTSTGQHTVVSSTNQPSYMNCFGGDTYVCIHKELWSGYGYGEYKENVAQGRNSIHVKYPVETRINLDRVAGPNFDTDPDNPYFTFEPAQLLTKAAQELPLNAYNDAYSAQEYNKVFVTKGAWDISDQHLGNRIVASEVKSTGELTDSFQDFKVANYIDVDGQYGPITNLVKYNGRLYYLQSTAFGTVSVNERSLITDNNNAQLLLGTGDVLQRYDYISTFNGSKEPNDPSIVTSPSSLYWYDSNKKSIQVFNQGGLNSLSKIKNAQSYFDKQVEDKLVHSGYDMKYNEVWFSPEKGDKSIIYSEQVQAFIGFYSKTLKYPKVGGRFSLGLTDNNKFIRFGECDGHINTEPSLRYVEFVVNQNAGMPKVFDTFSVNDCIRPMSGEAPWFSVKFSTNRQGEASQTRPVNKEGVYYMPIGRDGNKERMRDKIMTVKLTLNTTEFSIPSVSTMFRYSRI